MRIALVVVVLAALAGCGGGGGFIDPPDIDNPVSEWTYTSGDGSVLGVWSAASADGFVTNGVSITLHKDSQVELTAIGAVTGSTTGTADTDGDFTTTTGTIRASGTLTRLGAVLQLWNPSNPIVKVPRFASMIDLEDYSAYSGTWIGTYEMSDGIDHPMSIVVDSSGYLTCTITEGAAAGISYGRITSFDKKVAFQLLSPLPGWAFDGVVNDTPDPDQASGTIVSRELTNHETGTWSVVKQ